MNLQRGAVHLVNLGKSVPPELGKLRPAIVVSNTDQNELLPSVIVVPLSSLAPEIWPLRLKCEGDFLDKTSYAVIPGLRQVSKTRLEKHLGDCSRATLKKLDECLGYYLAD